MAEEVTSVQPMDARAILEERRRMREGRGQPAPAKAAAPQAAAPDPMVRGPSGRSLLLTWSFHANQAFHALCWPIAQH